jgi:flavin reductase (DIM6/NTAB) family NADH-FMN oxidoreductase RutF
MYHYNTKDLQITEVHKLLLGGIGPRPIALVSTLSEQGIPNLSPFSFFNIFGYNPPVIVFSPSRRGRDASLKDTYYNLIASRECVVQAVTYSMVEQISLASTEYPPDVDEFIKSGLTPIDSDIVKPKRVKESPFQMECKLREMISVGDGGGSANLAVCEVLKIHVAEDIFRNGIIQPDLIDLVARMSGNYYCRASGDAVFEVEKPVLKRGVGYDAVPQHIKDSQIFSANNLGKLANIEIIPTKEEVRIFFDETISSDLPGLEISEEAFYRYMRHKNYRYMLKAALTLKSVNEEKRKLLVELTAKTALEENDTLFAWKTALMAQ